MGFWGQMWMGKEDKARKIFEEQFGEPCPRAGGDGKNCILRWPQKKPFIYIKNVYSNGKMIKKEWYIFDNNTWRFVGAKSRRWCFEFLNGKFIRKYRVILEK